MSLYALKKGVVYDTNQESDEIVPFNMIRDTANKLSEIYGCFFLYAFDNAGRPIKIYHNESAMEKMALERLVDSDFNRREEFDLLDDDSYLEDQGGDLPDDDTDDDTDGYGDEDGDGEA
jgi:hypothetical protein